MDIEKIMELVQKKQYKKLEPFMQDELEKKGFSPVEREIVGTTSTDIVPPSTSIVRTNLEQLLTTPRITNVIQIRGWKREEGMIVLDKDGEETEITLELQFHGYIPVHALSQASEKEKGTLIGDAYSGKHVGYALFASHVPLLLPHYDRISLKTARDRRSIDPIIGALQNPSTAVAMNGGRKPPLYALGHKGIVELLDKVPNI